MQIKNWNIPLLCLLVLLLSLSSCTQEDKRKIIGMWERYDDRAAGTVVMVEKVNGYFEGKIIRASGELAENGFVENDVKWRNILPKTDTYFTGEDLTKGIDKDGNIKLTSYDDVYFEVIAEDILRVTYYADSSDDFGKNQKWKRIREIGEAYVADSLP